LPTTTHYDRELSTLNDLEISFPDFTGKGLSWVHNPDDPPDLIAQSPAGAIGLEFREWLDGQQMSAAQHREDQREHLMKVIGDGWQQEYQPTNIVLASIEPRWGLKIAAADEAALQQEFYKCATQVDQTWFTNPERFARAYYQTEFVGFPLMATYLGAIRYIDGSPHGLNWIQVEADGGAYDPRVSVQRLEDALQDKLAKFAKPDRQAKLAKHKIVETYLLIHGGWNAYVSNSPHHPLTLDEIAKRGAAFYADHPQRNLFNRVWFYDSLDSADDMNALFGLPTGTGRVRWLAQLWPTLRVY
jgi:hypothetical protein